MWVLNLTKINGNQKIYISVSSDESSRKLIRVKVLTRMHSCVLNGGITGA